MRRVALVSWIAVAACSSASLGSNSGIDSAASIGGSASVGDTDGSGTESSATASASSTTAGPTTDDSVTATDPSGGSTEDPTVAQSSSDSGGADTSGGSSSEGGSSSGGVDPLACTDADLGSATGFGLRSASTTGATDDVAISCASGGGIDDVLVWTAPAAGTYHFSLAGSGYDTAIAVLDDACDGAELICNDDGPLEEGVSLASVALVANQRVLLVIDGYAGDNGSYVLSISSGAAPSFACADGGDLGIATGNAVATGSTVGAANDFSPSCQAGGADVLYTWTPPTSGAYTFSLAGSSYDTVLAIASGGCGGVELVCNDDSGGLQSQASANLTAGQTVVIAIDGYNGATGSYTLAVN